MTVVVIWLAEPNHVCPLVHCLAFLVHLSFGHLLILSIVNDSIVDIIEWGNDSGDLTGWIAKVHTIANRKVITIQSG